MEIEKEIAMAAAKTIGLCLLAAAELSKENPKSKGKRKLRNRMKLNQTEQNRTRQSPMKKDRTKHNQTEEQDKTQLNRTEQNKIVQKSTRKRKINLNPTRCWIQNRRQGRTECENVEELLKEYKLASVDSYTLMDGTCFEELFSYISNAISKRDTRLRKCIPAREKLAATLRFLMTGESFSELDKATNLSKSFLHSSIMEVCDAIYDNMKDQFMQFPDTEEKWLHIANEYESRWNFANCLGSVDITHVCCKPDFSKAHLYKNLKGHTSVVLLAMVDANAKFTFVDTGYDGSMSDSEVFAQSELSRFVANADAYMPPPRSIGGKWNLPYVIVADSAFPLMENMLTPYSDGVMDQCSSNYNARLNTAWQNIESAFALMSRRFRILQSHIKLNEIKVAKIILCCCVLHNYLTEKSSWYTKNTADNKHSMACTKGNQMPDTVPTVDATAIRHDFAKYFFDEDEGSDIKVDSS